MTASIAVPGTEKNYLGGVAARLRSRAEGGGRAALSRALQACGEPMPASQSRSLAEWRAKHHPRFRIGNGKGLFLSRDGKGLTTDPKQAWFGSEAQLTRALDRFEMAAGMHGIRVLIAKTPVRTLHLELWGAR